METTPKYVQAQRIADILQIPEESVRRLARTNKIPGIKLGNLWRFDEAKLHRYLERKCSNKYSD